MIRRYVVSWRSYALWLRYATIGQRSRCVKCVKSSHGWRFDSGTFHCIEFPNHGDSPIWRKIDFLQTRRQEQHVKGIRNIAQIFATTIIDLRIELLTTVSNKHRNTRNSHAHSRNRVHFPHIIPVNYPVILMGSFISGSIHPILCNVGLPTDFTSHHQLQVKRLLQAL